MDLSRLNQIPKLVVSGKMSKEEGVQYLASFVTKNYKIFGLHKYDEDFRSDIVLFILEKGERIIDIYDSDSGDFFTFFYCFIKSQIKSSVKKMSRQIIHDKFSYEESVENYENNAFNYQKVNFPDLSINQTQVPYIHKKVTLSDLKKGIEENKLERYDRSLLILALKSAFYLTDSQILKICKIYDMDPDFFYNLIQFLRDGILSKKDRQDIFIQRRNSAYFHHKKYQEQIHYLEEKDSPNSDLERESLAKRNELQMHNLDMLNQKFENGFIYLRPSTKILANVLGICERQVNYYLQCVRKGKIDPDIIEKLEQEE